MVRPQFVIWHESQQISTRADGTIIFEAEVAGTAEIKLWILHWGARKVVLEPDELRDEIQSEAADMLAAYAHGSRQMKKTLIAGTR